MNPLRSIRDTYCCLIHFPCHLLAKAKWVSPVHHLSVSMDTREEAVIAHPAVEMPLQDCRVVVFFFSFHMHMWLWGLNVCMWGQMDTFMSAWVWIILQATSGAPHGTANCGERGRWACWRAPLLWALSNLFNSASSQTTEQKVREQSYNTNAPLSSETWSNDALVSKERWFQHCLTSVLLKDN